MMQQSKPSLFSGRGTRLLFLLALVCAAFSVVYAAVRIPLEDTRLRLAPPVRLREGWVARDARGPLALDEPSRPAAGCLTGTLRLENTLPAEIGGGATLCVQTKNECVRIWVDGALVYTYGETPQRAYGHGVGSVWNLAALPDGAAGKPVVVELTSIAKRTGLEPYTFLLGARGDVVFYLFQQKLPLCGVCLLLAIIGIGSLAVFTLGVIKRRSWAATTFYFALFVLLSVIWTLADSGLLQFFIPNKGVIYMLFGCSFYLLCTPFALLIAEVLPAHARLFRTFGVCNAGYALLRILLYMGGVMDFETALWILHLLLAGVILATNIILWIPAIRERKLRKPALSYAVSAFTAVSGISLILFFCGTSWICSETATPPASMWAFCSLCSLSPWTPCARCRTRASRRSRRRFLSAAPIRTS